MQSVSKNQRKIRVWVAQQVGKKKPKHPNNLEQGLAWDGERSSESGFMRYHMLMIIPVNIGLALKGSAAIPWSVRNICDMTGPLKGYLNKREI